MPVKPVSVRLLAGILVGRRQTSKLFLTGQAEMIVEGIYHSFFIE